jgi:hypothetical protein
MGTSVKILLVEDNHTDIILTKKAFEGVSSNANI